MKLEIFKCGTPVVIIVSKQKATISMVQIKYDQILYECSFYNPEINSHQTLLLHSEEFSIRQGEDKNTIGFKYKI